MPSDQKRNIELDLRDPIGRDGRPPWIRDALTPAPPRPSDIPVTRTIIPRRRRRPGRLVGFVALALLLVIVGAVSSELFRRTGWLDSSPTRDRGGVPSKAAEPVLAVARKLLPSVVQIETSGRLGSGVVYRKSGLILTAAHVVAGAREVTVRLADGTRIAGTVVGSHEPTDVGVVRVQDHRLTPAPLGVGEPVRVGELAVAIGSPFGLEGTVTSGVVSAVDRSIQTTSGQSGSGLIQTDASINPGNSGGALADRNGKVIGINDAIRSNSGVNAGVGFAIPIDTATSVAKAIVAGHKPRIGYLGIVGTEPAQGPAGALVTQVQPNSPAQSARLRPGDLITRFNGTHLEDMAELAARVRLTRPGTTVELEVLRNGRTLRIRLVIGSR